MLRAERTVLPAALLSEVEGGGSPRDHMAPGVHRESPPSGEEFYVKTVGNI